jgi:hypothetical protein
MTIMMTQRLLLTLMFKSVRIMMAFDIFFDAAAMTVRARKWQKTVVQEVLISS